MFPLRTSKTNGDGSERMFRFLLKLQGFLLKGGFSDETGEKPMKALARFAGTWFFGTRRLPTGA